MGVRKSDCVAPLFVLEWQQMKQQEQPPAKRTTKKHYSRHRHRGERYMIRLYWDCESLKHRRAKWLQKKFGRWWALKSLEPLPNHSWRFFWYSGMHLLAQR